MFAKSLALLAAVTLAALPDAASAEGLDGGAQRSVAPSSNQTVTDSYGDRNRGGPYGFYSYPRHRHVDGGSLGALDRAFSPTSVGTSPYHDGYHGSAYYGRDYGAPYYGGGYYDRGVYYRERRD